MPLLSSMAALGQILLIDLSLAGDNALAVGVAASGLPEAERHRATMGGIAAATALRILFAVFAVRIFHITGLLAAGGLLLLWVAWKMVREVQRTRHMRKAQENSSPLEGEVRWGGERLGSIVDGQQTGDAKPGFTPPPPPPPSRGGESARAIVNEAYILESSQRKKLSGAILQIAIADISMSLDNVLAVAGVARDHLGMLALGLALSVMLMGMAAGLVAKLTERHPWIAHLGIAVVLYTAVKMMGEGGAQFFHH